MTLLVCKPYRLGEGPPASNRPPPRTSIQHGRGPRGSLTPYNGAPPANVPPQPTIKRHAPRRQLTSPPATQRKQEDHQPSYHNPHQKNPFPPRQPPPPRPTGHHPPSRRSRKSPRRTQRPLRRSRESGKVDSHSKCNTWLWKTSAGVRSRGTLRRVLSVQLPGPTLKPPSFPQRAPRLVPRAGTQERAPQAAGRSPRVAPSPSRNPRIPPEVWMPRAWRR